jgi:hypothetical protein
MSDPTGFARRARAVLALGFLAVVVSGCGAKHHRSVAATPRLERGYSVRQVTAAFAGEGLPLTVLARDHGMTFLVATRFLSAETPSFSINVQIRPRLQRPGRVVVVVPGGHRLLWARNVVVDFDPASPLALKARAAVARLRRTPTG